MDKPKAYSGTDYPLNQLSSDRRFEKLLHRIFEYRIKDDLKGKFDKATLMQGGSERGRDVLLQLNGKVNGAIQCKMNTSGNLSKENVSKEIIKFALYYYQDNSLVDDLESFIYYFVCSDKFTGSANELLVDFKNNILKDEKLEKWIKSVLVGFSAFKSLVYENIENDLKEILANLIVKPKTESEINGWLHREGYQNIVSEFFEVRYIESSKAKLEETLDIHSITKEIKKKLIQNFLVWNTYGPTSEEARNNPLSNAYKTWKSKKTSIIVPNNEKIVKILEKNLDKFQIEEYEACYEFIEHARDFKLHCLSDIKEGYKQFPKKFDEVITKYVS